MKGIKDKNFYIIYKKYKIEILKDIKDIKTFITLLL